MVIKALKSGEFRNNLTSGIYLPKDQDQALAKLENAFVLFEKAQMVLIVIKKAIKENLLPQKDADELLDIAASKNIISKEDVVIVRQSKEAVYDAIQVDEYSLEDYKNI